MPWGTVMCHLKWYFSIPLEMEPQETSSDRETHVLEWLEARSNEEILHFAMDAITPLMSILAHMIVIYEKEMKSSDLANPALKSIIFWDRYYFEPTPEGSNTMDPWNATHLVAIPRKKYH